MPESRPAISTGHSLSELLSQTGCFAAQDALRIVRDIATHVETLHAAGLLHRGICARAIVLNQAGDPVLQPISEECQVDASDDVEELIPLELRGLESFDLGSDLSAASGSFRERGIKLDPRQVDVFALGGLLCRLLTGQSVETYLRSPSVKGDVPAALQTLIERACGLEGRREEFAAGTFAAAVAHELQALSLAPDTPISATAPVPRVQDTAPSIFSGVAPPPTTIEGAGNDRAPGELPFRHLAHYEVRSRIGCGGMGDVFLGYEPALDRNVALKVLPGELARHEDFISRFRAEATAAARLIHPGIVPIYFIGEDQGRHFFAMQYVDGESLASRLSREGALKVDETVNIIEQVLSALGAAHEQGMIHRDIKPGNILLDRRKRRALLADFGLVKVLERPGGMTATGVVMGTVDYISPEQGRGRDVDCRADLYSLGVLMYQMLSGRLPFTADSATAMIFLHAYEPPPALLSLCNIPRPLAMLVHKLLEKSPAARYQTAEEVLDDLQRLREGRSLAADSNASIGAGPSVRPTSVVSAAPAPDWPSLPATGPLAERNGWWLRLRQRFREAMHRHAPELLQQLQNTQQQVDGAVFEYERRARELNQLREDANRLLAEFVVQLRDCEDASQAAAERAAAAHDPAAVEQALAEKADCERAAAELRQQVAQQKSDLEPIEQQFRKANAALLNLRSQRDVLQARLKTARASAHVHGGERRSSRFPLRRQGIKYWVAGVGAIAIAIGVFFALQREGSLPPGENAQNAPQVEEPPKIIDPEANVNPQISLQQLRGHSQRVNAVAFSPRANVLASGSADGTIRIWDAATGTQLKSLENFGERRVRAVSALAYSPDGKYLAAGTSGTLATGRETIQLWDPAEGRRIRFMEGASGSVAELVFHPREPLLAVLHNWPLSELKVWSTKTGRALKTLRSGINLGKLAFNPIDGQLAVADAEGRIQMWDVQTGVIVQSFADHNRAITGLAFNRDGHLASADGQVVMVQDPKQHRIINRLESIEPGPAALAFGPDGNQLAAAYRSKTRIWDLRTAQIRGIMPGTIIESAAVSYDGSRMATGGASEPYLLLWDGKLPPVTLNTEPHTLPLLGSTEMSAKPEIGKALVTTGNKLYLFDLKQQAEPQVLPAAFNNVHKLALSPDGRHAVIGEGNGALSYWDLAPARELRRYNVLTESKLEWPKTKNGFGFSNLEFLPNGRQVFIATTDKMFLWDVDSGVETDRFRIGGGVSSAVSHDGRLVARGSIGPDGKIGDLRLFDVASGVEIRRFQGHLHYVWSLAFSPDSTRLLSGGAKTMHLWDVDTGKEIRRFVPDGVVKAIAFAPDGQRAAARASAIGYWDLGTGEELVRLPAFGLVPFEFSEDGKQLFALAASYGIHVWDLDFAN